jgi:hypothetical protein
MFNEIKIDPYGFREYDARWIYKKDIDLFGIENLGKGLGTQIFRDVVIALTSLGYKPNHAKKACSELEKNGELTGELESVIKKALKQLMS